MSALLFSVSNSPEKADQWVHSLVAHHLFFHLVVNLIGAVSRTFFSRFTVLSLDRTKSKINIT